MEWGYSTACTLKIYMAILTNCHLLTWADNSGHFTCTNTQLNTSIWYSMTFTLDLQHNIHSIIHGYSYMSVHR